MIGNSCRIAGLTTACLQGLKTLVAAATAAELGEALSSPGPFTVFAPTDEAFAKVQPVVDWLLLPENKDKLVSVLQYHVIQGKVLSTDLQAEQTVPTLLEGATLDVTKGDDGVKVNGVATVVTADVQATNGVAHVIDAVLVPAAIAEAVGYCTRMALARLTLRCACPQYEHKDHMLRRM